MRGMRLAIGFLIVVSAVFLGVRVTHVQETGIKMKKPVMGAACKNCPWGALADVVKEALKPYGYDVQICYNCWRGDAPRLVAAGAIPPSLQNNKEWPGEDNTDLLPEYIAPPPPNAPIEFGATSGQSVWDAWRGTGNYSKERPRENLRLFASIQGSGSYLVVAARKDSGITDLSQVKEKRWPVRILGNINTGAPATIMAWYGLTRESIEAAGGTVHTQSVKWPERDGHNTLSPVNENDSRDTFDIIIGNAGMQNNPENVGWPYVTQRWDLNYLQLPEELLVKLSKDFGMERRDLPLSYLRGVDHTIHTVVTGPGPGTVVYGRADNPDDFAYTVAKALDERQDLLQWTIMNFRYDRRTVWKVGDLPLHPGAARYYREMGYMK